jgi:hypothetical protein
MRRNVFTEAATEPCPEADKPSIHLPTLFLCIRMYGLFNEPLRSAECITSNWMIVSNEIEVACNEAIMEALLVFEPVTASANVLGL